MIPNILLLLGSQKKLVQHLASVGFNDRFRINHFELNECFIIHQIDNYHITESKNTEEKNEEL